MCLAHHVDGVSLSKLTSTAIKAQSHEMKTYLNHNIFIFKYIAYETDSRSMFLIVIT